MESEVSGERIRFWLRAVDGFSFRPGFTRSRAEATQKRQAGESRVPRSHPRPIAAVLEYFGFGGHSPLADARPAAPTFCLDCGRPIGPGERVLELRAGSLLQGIAASGGRPADPVFLHLESPEHCLQVASLGNALRALGSQPPSDLRKKLPPPAHRRPSPASAPKPEPETEAEPGVSSFLSQAP